MSLHNIINVANKMKSTSLNHRLIRQLWRGNEEDCNSLQLHTEVFWFTIGICMPRFFQYVWTQYSASLKTGANNNKKNLIKFEHDIAYLADVFRTFNEINLQFQGHKYNLIKTINVIVAFLRKLLLNQNLGGGKYKYIPTL